MHPDLPKLLELQVKDRRLAECTAEQEAVAAELEALDATIARAESEVTAASRMAEESQRRRDEMEAKLEAQRVQHDRRRQRLEQERNPRVAAQLMADVELGRSILAQEESDWVRLAEEATGRANAVTAATERLEALRSEQEPARAELATRQERAAGALAAAREDREATAGQLDRTLRHRYDRLRNSRKSEILVPVTNGTCTACYTAIPRSRLGTLQAEGILIEGCEMCGAIIYLAEVVV